MVKLRTARIKHDWPKNVLTFQRGGKKIRLHTTKGRAPEKAMAPVYAKSVNILEGLTEEKADVFLQENPTLVSLYEIDMVKEAGPFQYFADAEAAVVKLGKAREALEQELVVSQRVWATELEELNLGVEKEPCNVLVSKELDTDFKEQLTNVLREYKDVFM
jgi:hypothetical protein